MADASALEAFLGRAASRNDADQERAYSELLRFVRIVVRAEMGRRLRDHRESADVCQSIAKSFVDDFRTGRVHFDSERALAGYLRLAVRNKLAELARRDTALKRGGGSRPIKGGPLEPADAGDDDPNPAISREQWELVRDKMTEDEQRLADMRLRGLEWETIAAELGLTPLAARQRFSRMARRLRQGA